MSRTMPVLCNTERMDSYPGDEYMTAKDVFPIRVPLERVDLGRHRYQAVTDGDTYDLELLYEMQTSDLLVRTSLPSLNNTAGPGTFRIRGIQAAKFDLINEIPGSLEGMMTRLILELDQSVIFEHKVLTRVQRKDPDSKSIFTDIENKINCRKVTLISSIHETGHLRDILLFLKSQNSDHLINDADSSDNPYIRPFRSATSSLIGGHRSSTGNMESGPLLTFVDTLPWWSMYLPWWIYSRKFRKSVQLIIFLYSFFSIIWASWQLYRHVQFIHIALEPIVHLLREHLNDIMELLDGLLATLTYYWTSLLSPLNILVLPLWNSLVQLKVLFIVLLVPLSKCLSPLSKCLSPATNCLIMIWGAIINSKSALQSLDITKIQRNYITNLILSCLRASLLGLANLVGYSKNITKQKQAIKQQMKYRGGSSVASPPNIKYHGSVPVYYNSPLLRPDDEHKYK